jgi:hypothetical protein
MVDKVKNALRIKSGAFDGEIQDLINACVYDLRTTGILPDLSTDDPLIIRAVILYAKAYFGFSEEAGKYEKTYKELRVKLSLLGEYNAVG